MIDLAAVAFKAILKFTAQNRETFSYPCTVSDVNAAFYVFPDTLGDVVLPSNKGNLYLTDIVLSAAGTDTSQADIYINGKATGERILNAANLGTNFSRQFMGSPIPIGPGARLKIMQLT